MKKRLLALFLYLAVIALAFYLLPSPLRDAGRSELFTVCALGVIVLVCGFVFGLCRGMEILLPILTMLAFLPAAFLFFSSAAWIYSFLFGAAVLIGDSVGVLIRRKG